MSVSRTAALLTFVLLAVVASVATVAVAGEPAQPKVKIKRVLVVEKIDGRSASWWAARARSNGHRARALAAKAHDLSQRLSQRIEPLQARYEHAAVLAATAFGVDADTLIRKGRCESGNWTDFSNPSGAAGPWQFMPSTWRSTPFGRFSPYDPEAAALAAAWMHDRGRGGEWVCR